jgi:hypothetical protein
MFWDALSINRTDGALVRLTVQVSDVSEIDEADEQLADFLRDMYPTIYYYIPQAETAMQPVEG